MGFKYDKTGDKYGGMDYGDARPQANVGNSLHKRNAITGHDYAKTRAFVPGGKATTWEIGDFTKTVIEVEDGYNRSLWFVYPYTPAAVSPYYNRLKMLPYPPTAKMPTSLSGLTDGGAVTIKASRSIGFTSYKVDGGLAAGEKSTQVILDAEGKRTAAIVSGAFLFFQGKIVKLRHAGSYGNMNGIALIGNHIVLTKYISSGVYRFFCIPVAALNANGSLSYPFVGGERTSYSFNKLIADLPVLDVDGFAAGDFDSSAYYALGDTLCGQVNGGDKTKFIASNCVAPEGNLADAIVSFSMSGSPPVVALDSATPVNPATVYGSAIPLGDWTLTETFDSTYTPSLTYCGGVAYSYGTISKTLSTSMSGSLVSAGPNGESYPDVVYKLPIYTNAWTPVEVQIRRAYASPNAYQRTKSGSGSDTYVYEMAVCMGTASCSYAGISDSTDVVSISNSYVDTAIINGEEYVLDDVRAGYYWQEIMSATSTGVFPPDEDRDYWYSTQTGNVSYVWQQTYGRQNLVFLVVDPVADVVAYIRCTHGRPDSATGGTGESALLAKTPPGSTQPVYGTLIKLELVVKFNGTEHVSTLFELSGSFPGTSSYTYVESLDGVAETVSPSSVFVNASDVPSSSSETTSITSPGPGFYSYASPQPFSPLLQRRGRFCPADGKGGYIVDGDNLILYLNMKRSEFGSVVADGLVTCCKRFTSGGAVDDINDLLGMDALAPTLSFAKILYV